jgi:hypothetical protein
MDRVKFGRALGYGARHAAKTVVQAVDAATTPDPTPGKPPSPPRQGAAPFGARAGAGLRRIPDAQTVKAAGEQAKSSLVTPVVRFSSVLWLQLTGVFFALVAVTMAMAAWKARAGLHSAPNSYGAMKVYAYVAVCALFAYFTVSSFVRAARK